MEGLSNIAGMKAKARNNEGRKRRGKEKGGKEGEKRGAGEGGREIWKQWHWVISKPVLC